MKPDSVLLGAIADDYTGGSDLACMLSERGVRTVQVLGIQPDDFVQALQGYQAVTISLKSRSLPPSEACTLSVRALDQLTRLKKVRQVQFKYCSTFDSTTKGNIGPVIDSLMDTIGTAFTLAVPSLPVNGRTQYLGHLFVGKELLSESHLRHHPVTPMTDSNLVRHLQAQTLRRVGLVAYPVVRSGAESIRRECSNLQLEGVAVALVDAITDEDLEKIAEAAVDLPLITGGSGLAMTLPAAWTRRGLFTPTLSAETPRTKESAESVLMLSGSCSDATLRQIHEFRAIGGRLIPLNVLRLVAHGPEAEISFLLSEVKEALRREISVLVSSSASASEREIVFNEPGTGGRSAEDIRLLIEQVFAGLAIGVVREGLSRRLIVAGGETSGAVVDALKIQAAEVMGTIDPGVPYLVSVGTLSLALSLKSGNFGSRDFFIKASRRLTNISLS